jgi:hypothetical protein
MVVLFAGPLLGGVLAGYAIGGRLRHLLHVRFRAVWLLWLAAAVQFVHFEYPAARHQLESVLHASLLVPIFGLAGGCLVANLVHRPRAVQVAVALVLLGGGLNAAAIAANGRMPYAESAVRAAEVTAEQRARGERSPKHVAAGAGTRLGWLGDVIPVRPLGKVVSVGDLVLLAGVAALLAAAMRQPVPRTRTAPAGHLTGNGCGSPREGRRRRRCRPSAGRRCAAPGGRPPGTRRPART